MGRRAMSTRSRIPLRLTLGVDTAVALLHRQRIATKLASVAIRIPTSPLPSLEEQVAENRHFTTGIPFPQSKQHSICLDRRRGNPRTQWKKQEWPPQGQALSTHHNASVRLPGTSCHLHNRLQRRRIVCQTWTIPYPARPRLPFQRYATMHRQSTRQRRTLPSQTFRLPPLIKL